MIRIAVLGDIGSGKSFFAKQLNIPLFNADNTVFDLYKSSRNLYAKLKKSFPKYISKFPIDKDDLVKIIKIVHPLVRKEMNKFLKKNKNKKAVVLDIPLFLENKLNLNTDILVFIDPTKNKMMTKLKKRKNFNLKIYKLLKSAQLPLDLKKEKADFVVKNNFNSAKIKKDAKNLLDKVII